MSKALSLAALSLSIFLGGCGGGTGGPGQGTIQGTGPIIAAITPSTAIIGSPAITLYVNGSDFASGSEIQWNGSALVTTYVSSQQLTAQVTTVDLAASGTAQVTVFNPGGGGGTSNAQSFSVNYPIPVLSSISPTSAVVGSPMMTLTAMGSGFASGSQIEWNNTTLSTTFVSATELTAQVPASYIATAGLATITVVNPAPGGGTSISQPLLIISGATRIASVAVTANDIVWDSTNAMIYASVPGASGATGSVLAINPVTGSLGIPQPAGIGPNMLALSSDASHLWVGEDGSNAVQRFTLPNLTPDITIPLSAPGMVSAAALALKAAPDSPDTIAVLLGNPGSPFSDGVAIYDNAAPRPVIAEGSTENLVSLEWGADSSTLYGNQGAYGPFGFSVMDVNSSGVSLQTTYPLVLQNTYVNQRIHFDQATSYIYADDGRVLNPATGDIVGTFNLIHIGGLCAVDSSQGIVFFLGRTDSQSQSYTGYTILAFNKATYSLLGVLNLSQATGGNALDFFRWGNAGLAFNTAPGPYSSTPGGIYFVDGSFVNNSAPADFSSGPAVAPFPNFTSISPQNAAVGSGETTLTVTGANFQPGAVVYWNNQPLSTVYNNAAQLQAAIPASDLTTAGAATIAVSNGITTTQAQNALVFTVSPATSGITALNLAALDVAWDKNSSLLYVTVDSADPQYPNSIVAIDPTKGQIVNSQFVGSDPYLVRTTADGKYLYTSFLLKNAVTQLGMPTLSSPLSWSLGAYSYTGPLAAIDVQPAPGASQTTAISLGTVDTSLTNLQVLGKTATGNLTIFDNNVARPTVVPEGNYPSGYPSFYNFGSLQWGMDGSTLYAANPLTSEFDLYTLAVNSSGVSLSQDYPNAVENPILAANPSMYEYIAGLWTTAAIHYDTGTGCLYDDNGVIINPSNQTYVALNAFGLAAPDSSLNRIFILGQTSTQLESSGNFTLQSFDQTLFTPINSIVLSGIMGEPIAFVRWGASGLAFVTLNGLSPNASTSPGMLYILNNPSFVSASQ